MQSKAIILNAPPLSGKDVAASHLVRVFGGHHKEFKSMLFKATKAAYGVPDDVWDNLYQRETKELPSYYLVNNGKPISPRQAMINTSEEVVKPLFGRDAFGVALASDLGEGFNFISDGGFASEVVPLVDKLGAENVLVIRVHREGCSFENDSRNYLEYCDVEPGVTIRTLDNDTTLTDYFNKLEGIIKDWLR